MKHYGYVYLTTNTVNGMKYIGQHSEPELDEKYFGSGRELRKALKEFGRENFKVEILAWADSAEELNDLEISLLQKYNAVNSSEFYNLVNTYGGSEKGRHHSDETKAKLSCSSKRNYTEETRQRLLKANLGRHMSKEAREKISQANFRRWQSEEARKQMSLKRKSMNLKHTEDTKRRLSEIRSGVHGTIVQLTPDLVPIKEYEGLYEVRLAGFSPKTVSACCRKVRKTHKGFKFMLKSEYEKLEEELS